MRYLCLFLFLCLGLNAFGMNPIFLKVGDKVEELTLKSGKVYEDVKIKDISAKGVTVMNSRGISTIPPEELPDYAHIFRKFEKEDSGEEASTADGGESFAEAVTREIPEEPWAAKNLDDCVAACLKVEVGRGVTEYGQVTSWSGSAFLCNENGVSYIYSNVHNFFGAKDFRLVYQDGRTIPAEHLGRVEVADGEMGLYVKSYGLAHGWGGDVIRIQLKKFYPQALELDRTVLDQSFIGRDIAVTGNQGGRGIITKLEGKITETADYDIIVHNAATESGNSGSPIIDTETYKVVGVLTWGMNLPDPLKIIWEKVGEEERKGINSGASLARITFKQTSFEKLYEERILLNNMKRNVRLLGMMDTLIPSGDGLFVNTGQRVMGGYTVADLMRESPNHYIVKRLLALDEKIREKSSKAFRMSNQDLLKVYLSAYGDCLSHMRKQSSAIEDNMYQHSYYFQCSVKNTYMLEINRAYEKNIGDVITWYRSQRSGRNGPIPVTKRIRLPRSESGLQGLGIQQE